ncbi:hypothetical protein KT997_00045 [Proteus mirabilis]|uniref:hypothetical protein n=1 Tax=Proteus mirabilis TaxID=584 RepID=UPI0021825333|nr:hypothetical protein [Proteus mirabilis]MCT0080737.1 hypothetical protein [Proteus mirabilis]
MKGTLFHKDYPYPDLDYCYKNYDRLIDNQQWINNPLINISETPLKIKVTPLRRKLDRCFPRGKAYMRVSKCEFMAGN